MTVQPDIDVLFRDATKWRREGKALRKVLRGCGLAEELKWGKACYAFDGKNVVVIQRQNDFLALLFFAGSLMNDPERVLHNTGKNSRIGRRMLFTSVDDVVSRKATIEAYVREAIRVKKAGLRVAAPAELALPDEFRDKLAAAPALRAAFEKLTPGRQRHYCMYFSEPKQSKTRTSRIEKNIQRILDGKGLRDR